MDIKDEIILKIKSGQIRFENIPVELKNDKEVVLAEINSQCYPNMRIIPKSLRKNKEIQNAYWKKVYNDPVFFMGCSIIAVDDFGNSIIEKFKNIELKRHTLSRIEEFEEETEAIQLIKCNNGLLEKQIFEKKLNPLIIIIGNKRNSVANRIIKKYYNENDKSINIIEVYRNDIITKNIKFISKNDSDIINLLRLITYTTAHDTMLSEDNLSDIRVFFNKGIENKNLEVKLINDISELINNDFFIEDNIYICQIVGNSEKTLREYSNIIEKIEEIVNKNIEYIIEYHLHNSCNFSNVELYFLKI